MTRWHDDEDVFSDTIRAALPSLYDSQVCNLYSVVDIDDKFLVLNRPRSPADLVGVELSGMIMIADGFYRVTLSAEIKPVKAPDHNWRYHVLAASHDTQLGFDTLLAKLPKWLA